MAPVAADGFIYPARAGLFTGWCNAILTLQPTAYFCFFGFLTSFFGLLSFATEILPYAVDYNDTAMNP